MGNTSSCRPGLRHSNLLLAPEYRKALFLSKITSTCKTSFLTGFRGDNKLTRNEQVRGSSPLVGSLHLA